MFSTSQNPTPVTPEQIAAALDLVERALATFSYVEPLTPKQRKQRLKIRRGAHQVIPQITDVARTFAIALPSSSSDDLDAALAHARALEPLIAAVSVLHATLADDYLTTQGTVWQRSMALYCMLRSAARTHANLAVSLTTITAWFRAGRAKRPSPSPPTSPPPTPPPARA
jgi:hypothetical protein